MIKIIRQFQKGIRIDRRLSLDDIKELLADFEFNENEVLSKKYRSLISIEVWKDCIVLYPVGKCRIEFINEIKTILEPKKEDGIKDLTEEGD